MGLKITSSHEFGSICFLWGYDLVKFGVCHDLLQTHSIDPELFLFFDMVTVPPFIIGSARLVNALAGATLAWPKIAAWGLIVLANTLLPYGYGAVAGNARFDTTAWVVFSGLIFLILANLFRTIRNQALKKKNHGDHGF